MRVSPLVVLLAALPLLGGCGSVGSALGFGRNPPDEFAVVERPPLSLPPDYTLRPPRPGAPRPQEEPPTARAEAILFGNGAPEKAEMATTATDGEKALLQGAGADKATPGIRDTLAQDDASKAGQEPHLIESLLWWRAPDSGGATVDAAAEAQRLRDAKARGEPPAQSATPIIERGKSGEIGL